MWFPIWYQYYLFPVAVAVARSTSPRSRATCHQKWTSEITWAQWKTKAKPTAAVPMLWQVPDIGNMGEQDGWRWVKNNDFHDYWCYFFFGVGGRRLFNSVMSKSRGLNRSTMFNILHPSLAQPRLLKESNWMFFFFLSSHRYESQRQNLRERCGTIRPSRKSFWKSNVQW